MTKTELIEIWEERINQEVIWEALAPCGELKENDKNYAIKLMRWFIEDLKQLDQEVKERKEDEPKS